MIKPKSPSMSLFDQLGAGLDVVGQVEVPDVHRYADEGEIPPAEVPANTPAPTPDPKNFSDMKFTHLLIKHLDKLYSKMLAGDVSQEIQAAPSDNKIIDIAGFPHEQRHAYFNPGHSSVTDS